MEEEKEKIKQQAQYCLGCKVKMCQKGCPLENDITQFIAYIKEGKEQEAYETLCQTSVLSPICGRICPHKSQCEGACVRGIKAESVSIGNLEAYIGDLGIARNYQIPKWTNEIKDKTVAIVGGGPAGLTAAAYLARNGYPVTIYEKYDVLGGILQHGIPSFRLDPNIVEAQIEKILALGIQVKYGMELGKNLQLDELEKQYDAVFLAFGANISSKMGIPGENKAGVFGGNELLETELHPDYIKKRVAIIGGGNVAMDTARTVKRLGAEEVTIIYRRAEKQMPAERKEIEDAKQEGVQFLFQTNVVSILGEKKVNRIECIQTQLIKQEGENREVPVDLQGTNYEIPMDIVIMAVGSKVETQVVSTLGLKQTSRGNIQIDDQYRTSKPNVFAGGDVSGSKATVAWASRSGREAAKAIIAQFQTK